MDNSASDNLKLEEETKKKFFDFQLDMLKTEIDELQNVIGRLDEITQQIKNWSAIIWAGGLSLLIGSTNTDFKKLIFASAVIPFIFWIIDSYYRKRK